MGSEWIRGDKRKLEDDIPKGDSRPSIALERRRRAHKERNEVERTCAERLSLLRISIEKL